MLQWSLRFGNAAVACRSAKSTSYPALPQGGTRGRADGSDLERYTRSRARMTAPRKRGRSNGGYHSAVVNNN